jgi:hypothetical protein
VNGGHAIEGDLKDVLRKKLFEPFRIKLVNGDHHDVFDPQTVAVQSKTVTIMTREQHWIHFPINKIVSLESLIADFFGETAKHEGQ